MLHEELTPILQFTVFILTDHHDPIPHAASNGSKPSSSNSYRAGSTKSFPTPQVLVRPATSANSSRSIIHSTIDVNSGTTGSTATQQVTNTHPGDHPWNHHCRCSTGDVHCAHHQQSQLFRNSGSIDDYGDAGTDIKPSGATGDSTFSNSSVTIASGS